MAKKNKLIERCRKAERQRDELVATLKEVLFRATFRDEDRDLEARACALVADHESAQRE